ncbi:hypothetical protein A6V39_01160 [Candidatus Mycoplasma haematobovis]|uniref:Uncharacterized protein n=1 Tax=Candidatus Mycoplasma haematobovis TaxID=432608 RepID=A0A1A9QDI6_9MOLU|nr:hypothetical protein [Candidatus Mycoplasma haematobovis]OAL10662.1 hypothetical protein A6V39_01160 [Candidatus Mycoplasma haematobovis]
MAINPTLKMASIAVGAGGVVTGGAIGIYNHINKPAEGVKESIDSSTKTPLDTPPSPTKVNKQSIASLFEGSKKELLEASKDAEKWNQNWTSFKSKYNKNNIATSSWKFDHNWDTTPDNTAPEAFKQKCLANSKTEVENKNNELFKEVEQYCTKDKG